MTVIRFSKIDDSCCVNPQNVQAFYIHHNKESGYLIYHEKFIKEEDAKKTVNLLISYLSI